MLAFDFLRIFKRPLIWAGMICAWGFAQGAIAPSLPQVPLTDPGTNADLLSVQKSAPWLLEAGLDALQAGLPAVAEGFLSKALAQGELSKDDRSRAVLGLSAALLSLRQYDQARAVLEQCPDPKNAAVVLRRALLDYQQGKLKEASEALQTVSVGQLPESERPWLFLLEGLINESGGRSAQAEKDFEKARSLAGSNVERALFETAISRGRILSGKATPEMVDMLRKKVEENRNTRMEPQFAKELAVLLSQQGQKEEALNILKGQLDALNEADARDEKNQIRLLYVLLDGESSPQAQTFLQEILRGRGAREIQQNALYLLARLPQWRLEPDGFLNFLNEVLAQMPDHALCDEMLLFIAQLNLESGRLDAAQQAALRLVSDFPASNGRRRALRLLAQVAMKREPPRYRVAADYLNRLRTELEEGSSRDRLTLLLADLYFLNGDFANANTLYAELIALKTPPLPRGQLLFREVLSAIRADKLDAAAAQLDASASLSDTDAENHWRAEWSLMRALQDQGRSKDALERLGALLAREGDKQVSMDLRLRLLWLQAQLAFAEGQAKEAATLSQQLVFMVDTLPEKTLSSEDRARILASALLLQGQALLGDGKPEEAAKTFARLRTDYPDSDSAMLSYFVEARRLAAAGLLAEAQRCVMTIPEKYPENNYAPAALYEAAVFAEGQGSVGSYEQAAGLLDRIVRQYASSRYVFFARLRQGDIARKLNDFGAALIVYDGLLSSHANHPDRARVEMARADTYLALSAKDATKYSAAEAAFERLFALPGISPDMRVEAGFKWGFVLERSGNLSEARQAYWMVISRFLRNEKAPQLNGQGRYWMARCILQLGDLMARQGDLQDARTVYALIAEHGLPGKHVAASRLNASAASENKPVSQP